MYTCCPHCQTCFRITKAQLDVAQGKVRCGHCKQVFNGKQHLREQLPGQQTEPAAPVSSPTPPASAPPLAESKPAPAEEKTDKNSEIDFDLFDLSTIPASHPEDEAWLDEDDTSMADIEEAESDAWLDEDEFEEEDVTANLDEPYEESDELYEEFEEDEEELDIEPKAETPVAEAQSPAPSRYAYVDPEELRGEQQDIEKFIEEMNAQLTEAVEKPINIQAFDSAVDVDLSTPAEVEPEAPAEAEKPIPPKEQVSEKPVITSTDDEFKRAFLDNLDSTLAIQPTTPVAAEPEVTKPQPKPVTKPQPVKDKPAPPQRPPAGSSAKSSDAIPLRLRDSLTAEVKPRRPLMLILGSLAVLLFTGLLLVQVAFFRSSQVLDRFPAMQPLVERICAELPCRYSGPRDVNQIKLLNRDIRVHPKVNNALLISATFINRAPFKQPYPDITVSLSDLSGALVAQRRFTPAEYLGRLNSPFILMPSNKPVQIALEVVDPGKDAVNFEFTFQ